MRYSLLTVLGLIIVNGCDSGGGFFGGSGSVVEFSSGCAERAVHCSVSNINWSQFDDGTPSAYCHWDCAIYYGDEKVGLNFHGGEDPAGYSTQFKLNDDGCWELESFTRFIPDC